MTITKNQQIQISVAVVSSIRNAHSHAAKVLHSAGYCVEMSLPHKLQSESLTRSIAYLESGMEPEEES